MDTELFYCPGENFSTDGFISMRHVAFFHCFFFFDFGIRGTQFRTDNMENTAKCLYLFIFVIHLYYSANIILVGNCIR